MYMGTIYSKTASLSFHASELCSQHFCLVIQRNQTFEKTFPFFEYYFCFFSFSYLLAAVIKLRLSLRHCSSLKTSKEGANKTGME